AVCRHRTAVTQGLAYEMVCDSSLHVFLLCTVSQVYGCRAIPVVCHSHFLARRSSLSVLRSSSARVLVLARSLEIRPQTGSPVSLCGHTPTNQRSPPSESS